MPVTNCCSDKAGDSKNSVGLIDKIFGGFQVTSIINIGSGAPISIYDRNGTLNRSGRSNRQTAFSNLTTDQIRDLIGIFEAAIFIFTSAAGCYSF